MVFRQLRVAKTTEVGSQVSAIVGLKNTLTVNTRESMSSQSSIYTISVS